jgi:hypothetical protein
VWSVAAKIYADCVRYYPFVLGASGACSSMVRKRTLPKYRPETAIRDFGLASILWGLLFRHQAWVGLSTGVSELARCERRLL